MGTIADLNELALGSIAIDDYLLVRDTSDVTDKDKKVKAGSFPFKWTTAPLANRVAMWKDANTLQDAGYASSDVARLSQAQAFAGLQTFSAGIKFANETITTYDEGTYLPIIYGSVASPTVTYLAQIGTYRLINKLCIFQASININNFGGGSGLVIVSIPLVTPNVANYYQMGVAQWGDASSGINYNGTCRIDANVQHAYILQNNTYLPISGLAAGDSIIMSGSYFVA